MELIPWVLAVFATHRIAYMVSREDGPINIFIRFRGFVATKTLDTKHQWIFEGISCVLCVSFWLSWATAVLLFVTLDVGPVWLYALAIAGGCQFLQRYLYG